MVIKRKYPIFLPLLILLFSNCNIYCQSLRINEVMSSNSITFYDEDGDSPDWLELYNGGTSDVNLSGYGLSDDITLPYKWIFPDYILKTGEFLLLAASDKDRRTPPLP